MAAIAGAVLCEAYEDKMSSKATAASVAAPLQRQSPVRLRSRRITADSAKLYPPDGEERIWWDRLKKALGTSSSDFVTASLHQLQAAAQFPGSGISEVGINAALAFIEGFAPRNEVEASLAVQMACTHGATMSVLARLGPAAGTEDHACRFATAAARLIRAYSMQFEAYRRLRHGGDQYMRVEHVHINEGAQAVIGNVRASEPERGQAPETQMRADKEQPRGLEMGKKSVGTSTSVGEGIELLNRGLCRMRLTRDAAGNNWFTLVDEHGQIVAEGKLTSADISHGPDEGAA